MEAMFVLYLTWSPADGSVGCSPIETHSFPRYYDVLRFIDYRKGLVDASGIPGTLHIEVQEWTVRPAELIGDVLEFVKDESSQNNFSTDYSPNLSL